MASTRRWAGSSPWRSACIGGIVAWSGCRCCRSPWDTRCPPLSAGRVSLGRRHGAAARPCGSPPARPHRLDALAWRYGSRHRVRVGMQTAWPASACGLPDGHRARGRPHAVAVLMPLCFSRGARTSAGEPFMLLAGSWRAHGAMLTVTTVLAVTVYEGSGSRSCAAPGSTSTFRDCSADRDRCVGAVG